MAMCLALENGWFVNAAQQFQSFISKVAVTPALMPKITIVDAPRDDNGVLIPPWRFIQDRIRENREFLN